MALVTRISLDGKVVTIDISGRFDFSMHQEFRQVYEQDRGGTAQYLINQEIPQSLLWGYLVKGRA